MSELDLETKNIQILIYVIHQADLTPEFRKKINFNRMPTSVIGNRYDGWIFTSSYHITSTKHLHA
jgi:hypothetical protein